MLRHLCLGRAGGGNAFDECPRAKDLENVNTILRDDDVKVASGQLGTQCAVLETYPFGFMDRNYVMAQFSKSYG